MNKSIKILHAANLVNPSLGIIKQLEWELKVVDELNLCWETFLFCPKDLDIQKSIILKRSLFNLTLIRNPIYYFYGWINFKIEYYYILWKSSQLVDILLLRYSVYDPFQVLFAIFFRKKLYFIHHTKEIDEIKLKRGTSGIISLYVEMLLSKLTLSFASGIIAVTDEILKYQQKKIKKQTKKIDFFVYPNGILMDFEILKSFVKHEYINENINENINILFVASHFSIWHGLELLINNVSKSKLKFNLHIIGDVDKYLLEKIPEDKRIILHGKLNFSEYLSIACNCHVGLSSFLLEKKNMLFACTLKTREYLSLGIPVFSGHYDIFPSNFPFYRKGNLNIEDIIDFGNEMRKYSKIEIFEKSKNYIDKKILVDELYLKLNQ